MSSHNAQAIGEDQPPFGICVEYLDGRAIDRSKHVAGACGGATYCVVGYGGNGGDPDWEAESGDGKRGRYDNPGAGHIVFHGLHRLARFD